MCVCAIAKGEGQGQLLLVTGSSRTGPDARHLPWGTSLITGFGAGCVSVCIQKYLLRYTKDWPSVVSLAQIGGTTEVFWFAGV